MIPHVAALLFAFLAIYLFVMWRVARSEADAWADMNDALCKEVAELKARWEALNSLGYTPALQQGDPRSAEDLHGRPLMLDPRPVSEGGDCLCVPGLPIMADCPVHDPVPE